jgi:hypothetical protein
MTTQQTEPATSANPPSLNRHARKCKVCKHPDREDIELDFLHWHNCADIAADYEIEDARGLYRHAHATGLWERRNLNLRFAVAHIVEHAESVEPSANGVLKAIEACSQITDRGEWIRAPKRIIHQVEHHHMPASDKTPPPAPARALEEIAESEISNRQWMRLENAATPTKQ